MENSTQSNWPYTHAVNPAIYASRTNWPKISIVTPSFNQGQFIEETILSILNQNYPNLEYIIIDGGSTDNTVEVIKKYEDKITYWVSEPDKGQADAINKGLEKCTGEIFNWINSDDYLTNKALYTIADEFDLNNCDCIAGHVCNFYGDRRESRELSFNKNLTIKRLLSINTEAPFFYHQPGVWFRLDLLRYVSPINIDLRYAFDFELMLKYIYKYKSLKYINFTLVNFRLHPSSKTVSQNEFFNDEREKSYYNFLDYIENDRSLKRKTVMKLKSIEWHKRLTAFGNKNPSAIAMLMFLLKNVFLSPRSKTTRMTLGKIRSIFRIEH